MIQQIDIYTKAIDTSRLYSDLSVKIHGYIMSKISSDYAAELHDGTVNPFSIYTVDAGDCYITRISVLNRQAQEIIDVFEGGGKIRVFGTDSNLELLGIKRNSSMEFSNLVSNLNKNKYRLSFVTPAMFRQNGVLKCTPDLSVYFNSVVQKLSKFEKIEIAMENVRQAFDELKIEEYSLQTQKHKSGSRYINGMTGYIDVVLPQEKEAAKLLKTILAYATFSGVGGQTTQGMGGFILERR